MARSYEYEDVLTPKPRHDVKIKIPYLPKIIKMSKFIRMWPNTGEVHPFNFRMQVWLISIYCTSFVTSFAVQFLKEIGNLESMASLIDYVTVFTSGTFRYVYVYVRADKYLFLVSQMENNFISSTFFPTQNRTPLLRERKWMRRILMLYGLFLWCWVLEIATVSLLTYVWENIKLSFDFNKTQAEPIPYPIPMRTYAPFDYETQPGNAFFFIYQTIGSVLFGYIFSASDAFWVLIILLTIDQFNLIKESLDTMSEAMRRSDESGDCQLLSRDHVQKVSEGLKLCIKQHQITRQFVLLIDDLFNPLILVQNMHCLISICFMLLDAIVALSNSDFYRIMTALQFFTTSTVHLFWFNFLANQLACKEEELADAVYELQWYRCPSERLKIQMMIAQSRKPYRLTGGRIYKIGLEFFASMTKTIFSYSTFLFQIRNAGATK